MNNFTTVPVLVLAAVLWSGCTNAADPLRSVAGPYRNDIKVKGKIEADRYYSSAKNFSCAIPPLVKPGAVIRDEADPEKGFVRFEDDIGTLVRVDYFMIPDERAAEFADSDRRKVLASELFKLIVERMYRPPSPQTKVTHTEYLELQNGLSGQKDVALFGVAFLPKGASLADPRTGRYDALRASLVFFRGRYSYLLTIQDIPGQFGERRAPEITEAERNKELLKKLQAFHGTCSFY